jgi:hypothetical protein
MAQEPQESLESRLAALEAQIAENIAKAQRLSGAPR